MKIEGFEGATPRLVLEDYFAGETRAWGIFEDRYGNLRRAFRIDIAGTGDGRFPTMIEDFLYEDFLYSDGETDWRIWRIEKRGEGQERETRSDPGGKQAA